MLGSSSDLLDGHVKTIENRALRKTLPEKPGCNTQSAKFNTTTRTVLQYRPTLSLYQKPKSKMTKSARDELDATLRSLSRDTWERLSVVSHLSALRPVRFGEETITDLLMLELNRQTYYAVRFHADFEAIKKRSAEPISNVGWVPMLHRLGATRVPSKETRFEIGSVYSTES